MDSAGEIVVNVICLVLSVANYLVARRYDYTSNSVSQRLFLFIREQEGSVLNRVGRGTWRVSEKSADCYVCQWTSLSIHKYVDISYNKFSR